MLVVGSNFTEVQKNELKAHFLIPGGDGGIYQIQVKIFNYYNFYLN